MRQKRTLAVLASIALMTLLLASNYSEIQGYTAKMIYGASANNSNNTRTPIKHVIFLIVENIPFDPLFGVFPGVPANASLNLNTCLPLTRNQNNPTPCTKPFNADNTNMQEHDLCHTAHCALSDYNGGMMDGFRYTEGTNQTMGYYDGNAIPQFWDLAQHYNLDYNFFSSAISYSEPNHLFTVAADNSNYSFWHGDPGATNVSFLNFTFPEIGTELTQNGVSWGYFQSNWNDSKDCTGNYTSKAGLFSGSGDGYWEGEAQFRQVQNTAVECSSLGNINDFENALATNTLPAVSWVIPEPSESCHPGQGTLQACEQFVTSVINDIEQSQTWSSSVTYLTWDDFGGYYDGVAPTWLDQYGDGFRVPLIAISPYTIQGFVGGSPYFHYYDNFTGSSGVSNREDFSAFLSTVEYNWNLRNLTNTDGEEPNLFYMLNFSQAPLPPIYFAVNYSLAKFPLSACYSSGGCSQNPIQGMQFNPSWILGSAMPTGGRSSHQLYSVYNASTPSWAESQQQALNNSGNGDPFD